VDGKYIPCNAGDPGATAITYREIADDNILEPPLQMIDLITALREVKPSIEQREISKFEEWTRKFGITG
jgi:vacuolar protein-sorting-associated protein 4